jgi:hypothetical protein
MSFFLPLTGEQTKGIPEFWLTVLKNVSEFSDIIKVGFALTLSVNLIIWMLKIWYIVDEVTQLMTAIKQR